MERAVWPPQRLMKETRTSTNRIEERDDRRAHLRKVAERLNLDCHEYAPTLRLL